MSEGNVYKLTCPKAQCRSYSIPYEQKVAKFKGKKGSDVCDNLIIKDPPYSIKRIRSLKDSTAYTLYE